MEEHTLEEVTYKRAKKNTYTDLANLERVVVVHKIHGDYLSCKECGEQLVEVGVK